MRQLGGLALTLSVAFLFTACATGPRFDDTGINKALTPAKVIQDFGAARGQKVRWGGVIISSSNLPDRTQLEVLAYPLDDDARPQGAAGPLGRFLATKSGYLETVDYAPGRLVTITGQVHDVRQNKIGEATYNYPVLAIDQAYLWPEERRRTDPQFHFGIGIGVGL